MNVIPVVLPSHNGLGEVVWTVHLQPNNPYKRSDPSCIRIKDKPSTDFSGSRTNLRVLLSGTKKIYVVIFFSGSHSTHCNNYVH